MLQYLHSTEGNTYGSQPTKTNHDVPAQASKDERGQQNGFEGKLFPGILDPIV